MISMGYGEAFPDAGGTAGFSYPQAFKKGRSVRVPGLLGHYDCRSVRAGTLALGTESRRCTGTPISCGLPEMRKKRSREHAAIRKRLFAMRWYHHRSYA